MPIYLFIQFLIKFPGVTLSYEIKLGPYDEFYALSLYGESLWGNSGHVNSRNGLGVLGFMR